MVMRYPPKSDVLSVEYAEDPFHVELRATPKKDFAVRKVTGTSLGALVGRSPWKTPFRAQCDLLGLCDEDLSREPAIIAGKVLEGVIFAACRDQGMIPAEELFAPREGDHDQWPSDFEDPDFAGHLDGVTADGQAVVEVKTTVRPEDWNGRIPEHYWLQASLYARCMGLDRIVFLVGMLTDEDRAHPASWNPEGNIYRFDVEVHPEIDALMDQARRVRQAVAQGAVLVTDDPRDRELAEYFQARQMGALDIADTAQELAIVDAQIDAVEDQNRDLYARQKMLRERLKTAMQASENNVVKANETTYKLTESERTSIDKGAMLLDGIDPDKYTVKTTVYTLKRS